MAARATLAVVLASIASASCGGAEGGGDGPLNALLITLDTARPKTLGCYGVHPGLTPNLDAVAAEGVIYESARTVTPLTLPSHASMLTGLYPPRHTVRANSQMALPQEAETIAELARERGYETAAFVAAVVLDESFGLDQGFETYDQPKPPVAQLERHYEERPAEEVVDAALAWLEQRDGAKPFLAWLHFFDPHAPYEPPEEFLRQAGGDPYLGEMAKTDAEIGRFLDALRDADLYDDTLVVVVADHGEGLWEHGEETHGFFGFDSTIRVPFVVRDPRGDRRGERSPEVVSVVDVYPTLAEALELPLPDSIDGESLFRREVSPDRGVYFESFFGYMSLGWSPLAGWATKDGKYLHSSRPEFFDLAADPGETRNVVADRGDEIEAYRAEIGRVADRPALASATVSGASEELMERLRDLGYTGAGVMLSSFPHPLEPSDRVSPHERIEAYARFQRAQTLSFEGQPAEALPLLEEIVAANPANATAHFQLAGCLVQLQRFEEAVPHLQKNLALRGSWRGVHINLGFCYEGLGRKADAVREFGLALEHDPGLEQIMVKLIALLDELGRADEANVYRLRLRELQGL